MLHLTSDAFKTLFHVPRGTKGACLTNGRLLRRRPLVRQAPGRPRCTACSAALEGEIPHSVTQAFAAFLEARGIALGGPGNEPFIR
jgi:hypothetical protein